MTISFFCFFNQIWFLLPKMWLFRITKFCIFFHRRLTTNLSKAARRLGNTKIISSTEANAPAAMQRSIISIILSFTISDMANGASVMIIPEVRMVCVDDWYALRMDSILHSIARASR